MPGFYGLYFILHIAAINLSYAAFFAASIAALLYLIEDSRLKNKDVGIISLRLPDLSSLDKFNYRFIGLGFPLLTLAIIAGSLWAKGSSGFYWDWNTRWIYSLVIWLIYAVILHVRLSSKIRGRKVAILSLAAFIVIVLSLLSRC